MNLDTVESTSIPSDDPIMITASGALLFEQKRLALEIFLRAIAVAKKDLVNTFLLIELSFDFRVTAERAHNP